MKRLQHGMLLNAATAVPAEGSGNQPTPGELAALIIQRTMGKSAFELADEATATAAKGHRISPTSAVVGGNLVVSIPLAELANCRHSNSAAKELGFNCDLITFPYNNGTYALRPGWIGMKRTR